MKILVFNWQDIKNPLGGGAEVHLHEIFSRLAGRGHDITLCCCRVDGRPDEEVIDGIKVVRRGNRNTFNFSVPRVYKKEFMKQDFDLVIDDINKIPFYTPLFIGKKLIAISHHFFGKSIFRETNFIAGLYVYLSEKLVDIIYRKTPFIVVSESTKQEFISRGFEAKNLHIVTNAIAPENYPMSVTEKYGHPTITYFGRLKKYKSVDHAVLAFAEVKKAIPHARMIIMGKGDFDSYLKELAEKSALTGSIEFTGFVTDEKKAEILSRSHVVVNTSMKEGWGITNIEANACGTPVLSADSPGLRDSIKKGISGDLYEYGNIPQFAGKLIEMLKDREKLKTLSYGAVEWAATFSWEKSADEMEKLLRRYVNDRL